ncbi:MULTISPECIES: MarR family winged helix-turn-helix transcriptional regulator [Streptomyces]|uniref:MarR family transcriptional regulator n=1 Tax=Streptomyces triticiradicis TaxID=2651189 RepID=A0A7J5DPX7_9ACTN|nr:MarR family transcriptional regulator [Streptomyces triticiradicis]KAB1990806.1 MarR family transcriptional regulator [Streptomyces triticiradicis]
MGERTEHEDAGRSGSERRDGRASAEIRQGVIRLARRLSAERPADGLSLNKSSVLGHLRRNGPMSAGALAAADHQQPQSLTRVFADLEQEGLISRTRDAQDGRQRVVQLTEAGREALARDMAQRDAWLDIALVGLTETERQVLLLAARLMNGLADSPVTVPGSTTRPH